jgi:hypothetical protein
MITYSRKLHAANIAAFNAANDQADIDRTLAAELQKTINAVKREATKSALKTAPIVSDRS